MKSSISVTELTHEEIVSIIADAFSMTDNFTIVNDDDFYDNWFNTTLCKCAGDVDVCFEDKVAAILLNGGGITIMDNYGEEELNECGRVHSYINKHNECCYDIFLSDFLAAGSTPEGYEYLTELLVNEGGDGWDAYNFLQLVVFGEEIYG